MRNGYGTSCEKKKGSGFSNSGRVANRIELNTDHNKGSGFSNPGGVAIRSELNPDHQKGSRHEGCHRQ
jgi:hypothetical protein